MTTSAARSQDIPPWLRAVWAAPNALYAHGLGSLLGHRFVQIRHRGRRTGLPRRAVVEVLRYNRSTGEAVVVAGYGRSADWYRNVLAAGGAELDFGHGARPAAYRVLSVDEAADTYRAYERRNRLIRPGVRLTLTLLLGWRFDGSDDAVRRMVQELPMIAFRPRHGDDTRDGLGNSGVEMPPSRG